MENPFSKPQFSTQNFEKICNLKTYKVQNNFLWSLIKAYINSTTGNSEIKVPGFHDISLRLNNAKTGLNIKITKWLFIDFQISGDHAELKNRGAGISGCILKALRPLYKKKFRLFTSLCVREPYWNAGIMIFGFFVADLVNTIVKILKWRLFK